MKTNITKQDLINFEDEIANCFNNKQIRAPIHLQDGNLDQLIEIFKEVNEDDWICTNWRSHSQCLLKGVSSQELKQAILDNKSISLCFAKHKIVSSAIVGGTIPIATGLAMDIKRKKQTNKVWCFLGEMTSTLGIFHENYEYSFNHQLPITYVVEDNGKSVCTNTRNTWNNHQLPKEPEDINLYEEGEIYKSKYLYYFKYNLDKYPHAGPGGKRIQF